MNFSIDDERDPEKMRALLASMTPQEEDRFEHYRRSRFHRGTITKVMQQALPDDKLSDESTIVVASLAKMYVGDLVKAARAERVRRGDGDSTEPITPSEFAAAARSLQRQVVPTIGDHKRPRLNGPPVFSKSELLD